MTRDKKSEGAEARPASETEEVEPLQTKEQTIEAFEKLIVQHDEMEKLAREVWNIPEGEDIPIGGREPG
jgi:hypothetical protein